MNTWLAMGTGLVVSKTVSLVCLGVPVALALVY